jgi:hypothetical protein
LRAQRKRTTLAITFTLAVAIGCRRKEGLVGGNRTKHDKRDTHQKNQDSLSNLFFFAPLPHRTQRPYFGTCRHNGTATFSCSATLKDNLFNFTAQSVSAILGEVGTSIANTFVTKKQGKI